jgi:hypothetical protein
LGKKEKKGKERERE